MQKSITESPLIVRSDEVFRDHAGDPHGSLLDLPYNLSKRTHGSRKWQQSSQVEKRSLLSPFHRKWLIVRDFPQRLRLTATSHYQPLARKSLLETWVTHVSALVSSGQRETDRQRIHRMEFEKSGFIVQRPLKHQSHDWCFTTLAAVTLSKLLRFIHVSLEEFHIPLGH